MFRTSLLRTKVQTKKISREKLLRLGQCLQPFQQIGENFSSRLQNYIVAMYLAIPASRVHQIIADRSLAGSREIVFVSWET